LTRKTSRSLQDGNKGNANSPVYLKGFGDLDEAPSHRQLFQQVGKRWSLKDLGPGLKHRYEYTSGRNRTSSRRGAWRVPPYAIGSVAAFWLIQRIAAF
jgi:hypothetical protein